MNHTTSYRNYSEHIRLLSPKEKQILQEAVENRQVIDTLRRSFSSNLPITIEVKDHQFTMESMTDFGSLREALELDEDVPA